MRYLNCVIFKQQQKLLPICPQMRDAVAEKKTPYRNSLWFEDATKSHWHNGFDRSN